MTQLRSLLIGTALSALATSGVFAQTSAQPAAGMQDQAPAPVTQMAPAMPAAQAGRQPAPAAQGVQMPTPAPQTLTAPGSTDPLVQKRNADAQANAEYRASKKTAKTQYKEQVQNAKINKKADKQTANNQMNAELESGQGQPTDTQTNH
jgi:hypothetical protein